MFSIVIPLFNKEKFIAETLHSVVLQSYHDYEVIIVNDNSTDNSLAIAQTFEVDKRFKVYTKLNGGVLIQEILVSKKLWENIYVF